MAGNELFHLANGAPPRCSKPLALGRWDCDTRELPHRGKGEGPRAELCGCLGQRFECLSDAQLLVLKARAVAEKPLGVLLKGAVPELAMGFRAEGAKQPASFLEIDPGALRRESKELFVSAPPRDVSVNVLESDYRC